MGKLKDFLLGSSDERKNKQLRKEKQKNQMLEQKEGNKKIRAFYKKRSLDEKNQRQVRVPKHKLRTNIEKNSRR